MNLKQVLSKGLLQDDVKEIAALFPSLTVPAIYRGIVRCPCGMPVLLHIEAVWRNQEPTMLRAAISGESCPGCGSGLSPSTVTYIGIFSPGWPIVPATTYSSADLYHAMDLMEVNRRDTEQANPLSTDTLRSKHEEKTW